MSVKTIENLPEEILIDIFKLVGKRSLQNVVLTNKRWKEIAEQSMTWPLLLQSPRRTSFSSDDWEGSSRKYYKVTIDGSVKKGKLLENLQLHGAYVQELSMYYGTLSMSNNLQLLYLMPNLKKIIIYAMNTTKTLMTPADQHLPPFSKLKTLEMIICEYSLLNWFKRAQLDTLKVLNSESIEKQPPQDLINFLATQKKLTTLALRSFTNHCSEQFQTPIDNGIIPFRLKKLSLQGIKLRTSPNDYNNLLKFMGVHSETIEELELGKRFPDFFYEFVFAKFKNLKTLRLAVNEMPTEADFFDRLETNSSVISLIINDDNYYDVYDSPLKKIIMHLSSIQTLNLYARCGSETMRFIGNNLAELRNFSYGFYFTEFELQFLSLASLKLCGTAETCEWDTFTTLNSAISKLYIIGNLSNENIEIITRNLKTLQTLILTDCAIEGDEGFFDIIRKNCKNLELLDINVESLQKVDPSKVADIRGLRLREASYNHPEFFPNDEFWNENDYIKDLLEENHNWEHEEYYYDSSD